MQAKFSKSGLLINQGNLVLCPCYEAAYHSISPSCSQQHQCWVLQNALCKAAAKKGDKMCRVCCVSFYVRPNVLWGNMNTEKKLPSSLLFSFFFLAFSFSFSFSFFSLPPFHLAPSLSFLLYTHMLTTFVMGQKKKNACLIIIFWCAKPYFCSEIKDSWAEQRMLCFS